jgi:hypothetical protein
LVMLLVWCRVIPLYWYGVCWRCRISRHSRRTYLRGPSRRLRAVAWSSCCSAPSPLLPVFIQWSWWAQFSLGPFASLVSHAYIHGTHFYQ